VATMRQQPWLRHPRQALGEVNNEATT